MTIQSEIKFTPNPWRWMAAMMMKGYPLPGILESIAALDRRKGPALERAAASVQAGEKLSAALKKAGISAPQVVREMIETGEQHGKTAETLAAAGQVTGPAPIKSGKWSLRGSLVYIWLVALALAYLQTMMIILVIPTYSRLFLDFGGNIPRATIMVVEYGKIIAAVTFLIFALATLGVFSNLLQKPAISFLLAKIPLIGRPFRLNLLWKTCHLIGSLVKAGIPLPAAVSASGRALGWKELASAGERLAARVRAGEDPWAAVIADPAVPAELRFAAGLSGDRDTASDAMIRESSSIRVLEAAAIRRAVMAVEVALIILLLLTGALAVLPMYLPLFNISSITII